MLISLKKYLEMSTSVDLPEPDTAEPQANDAFSTVIVCYRAALSAIGRSAVEGCPVLGVPLEDGLQPLRHRLSFDVTSPSLQKTQKQVEFQLKEWAGRTARHLKKKADEARELLIILAKTAESVGNRNQGYTRNFRVLTSHLESIANLDDLTQIRASLIHDVTRLKGSVDEMTRESQELVSQLRAEVLACENRLTEVEDRLGKDELTGLANRRSVEERMQCKMELNDPFCVLILDLDGFKEVNDRFGHPAGDDLLKRFASELKSCTRTGDLVGRWGGDEFIVLLDCDLKGAAAHITRIKEWAFGKYKIQCNANNSSTEVHVNAAIGVAGWHSGQTIRELVAQADDAMYQEKKKSR
jgi:diguanylate cyclase (GGDEF)-like protein